MQTPEQAVADCYTRYFGVILGKCTRMLANRQEAEDVAQDTFVRLWRELGANANIEQTTAWIYRTSTRLAIDLLRQRKRRPQGALDGLSSACFEDAVHARDWLERIAERVPARELEVCVWHRIDKLEQSEIAALLGCSERQVRRLLTSFDEKLKRIT